MFASLLNISGDFTNNGTLTQGASSLVSFVGNIAQVLGGSSTTSFTNLTISNSTAAVSVNTNTNVSGTFSAGAGALVTPGATVVFNSAAPAGTISGSGTIQVTRIAAPADYSNQYKFTINTLSGLTVDYAGAGAQSINSFTYGNLKTSGSGTKTIVAGFTVNGNVTIGAGTILDEAALTMTLSSGSVLAVNGTLNFSSSAGFIRTGTTGTSTLTMTGGSLTIGGWMYVGWSSTHGTVNLNGGTITTGKVITAIVAAAQINAGFR